MHRFNEIANAQDRHFAKCISNSFIFVFWRKLVVNTLLISLIRFRLLLFLYSTSFSKVSLTENPNSGRVVISFHFFRVLRSVERFDPKTGSWSEVRAMGTARMAAAVAKYRDYIWVAGGMTGEKRHPVCANVECYNSKTNQLVLY